MLSALVFGDLDFGHADPIVTLPYGAEATIRPERKEKAATRGPRLLSS